VSRSGVLLLGFGGPESVEDVRPFMRNLMGREPSDALVDSVIQRYESIGGGSPLPRIAAQIAAGLEERLEANGLSVPVRVGMRYWNPFIADSIAELVGLGCSRIVTVSLSPFESQVASGAYREAIEMACKAHDGVEVVEAPLVSRLEAFTTYFADSTRAALAQVGEDGAVVAFTAHSLPISDIVEDDPYLTGLQSTAMTVAEKIGLAAGAEGTGTHLAEGFSALGTDHGPHPWYLVYQSKGAKPGPWLGPELGALVDAVAASPGSALVVCPLGFMTDHMETLWDLDSVAADHAAREGVRFARATVPNDDAAVLDAILASAKPLL